MILSRNNWKNISIERTSLGNINFSPQIPAARKSPQSPAPRRAPQIPAVPQSPANPRSPADFIKKFLPINICVIYIFYIEIGYLAGGESEF